MMNDAKFTVQNWLKIHRPKVAIHPHRSDYCDKCKRLEMEISRAQKIMKRLRQSGSATQLQLQELEDEKKNKSAELADHTKDASKAQ